MLHRQPRQPKSEPIRALSKDSKKALKQLALESIIPSEDLLTDMALLDAGQITPHQYKQRAIARATAKA